MSEITELSALEYRCVMAAVAVPDDNELGPDYSAIVRAVLAEAGVAEMRSALTEAREQFAYYAEHHAAKGTEDADSKAAVNHAFVCKMQRALAMTAPSNPPAKPCPAVRFGWCKAPWGCAQPCTGRGGNSHAAREAKP